jgi:hypothetical protein
MIFNLTVSSLLGPWREDRFTDLMQLFWEASDTHLEMFLMIEWLLII